MSAADRRAELQAQRAADLQALVDDLLPLKGDERVLDIGAGTGAFAFAVAQRAREVVAVEKDDELAARARADAPANVNVIVGDGEHLQLGSFSFDVSVTLRTLHHTPRPELLVADQLAPVDPMAASELNQFERARDPSTTRVLSDGDMRALFDSNNLVLRRDRIVRESREIEWYLDLAGCEGPERELVKELAPTGYEGVVGWYVLGR